jgi:hypothetical protein
MYRSGLMPIYDFYNSETDEIESYSMRISELDQFKEDNPNLSQKILDCPSTVRGTGGFKNDEGWKENLARIAEAHPTTPFAEKVGGRKTKTLKTHQVLKKHGLFE